MTEERFLTLAGVYGAEIARWPAAERAAAEAFASDNPEIASACLAAELMLDRTLARYDARSASAALERRIAEAAPRERLAGRAWRWIAGAGLGLGLAASAAAGVATGYTLGHPAVTRMLGPSELDLGEMSALDPGGSVSG